VAVAGLAHGGAVVDVDAQEDHSAPSVGGAAAEFTKNCVLAVGGGARRDELIMSNACPCGSGKSLDACCGPYLAGMPAPTPEALMRSRYSAYVTRNYAHLERTLAAAERAEFSEPDARRWAESSEWLGLTITETTGGGPHDDEGTVAFSAKFRTQGEVRTHVENARFIREDGRWVYAGEVRVVAKPFRREAPKLGRNDPCHCGSGKKYKKCHGAEAA
jgi:SEC-C motif domain protein